MPRRFVALLLLTSALLGCETTRVAPNPLEIDRNEYERLHQAAQAELRERGFRIDRADYRFGKVESQPRTSPSIFEVWQADNTTAHQTVASTVNHQRRIVTVTMEPMSPETPLVPPSEEEAAAAATQPVEFDTYLLRVEVQVEQKQVTTRQLTGSTRGERLQHNLFSVPQELRERGIGEVYWEPVGRDYYLEQRLLAAIVRRSVRIGLAQEAEFKPRTASARSEPDRSR